MCNNTAIMLAAIVLALDRPNPEIVLNFFDGVGRDRSRIYALTFSPDNLQLACTLVRGRDPGWEKIYRIYVWTIGTGKVHYFAVKETGASVKNIEFVDRNTVIGLCSLSKKVSVHYYDLRTGTETKEVEYRPTGVRWYGSNSVATRIPGTSSALVKFTSDRLAIWDYGADHEVWSVDMPRSSDEQIAVSNDGNYIAASGRKSAFVWRLKDKKRLTHVETADNLGVTSLALSRDGRYLAMASLSGDVAVHDLNTFNLAFPRIKISPPVADSLTFSPKSDLLIAFGQNLHMGRVVGWDVSNKGKEVFRLDNDDHVQAVAFSRDGRRLAVASKGARVVVHDLDDLLKKR
jgi:WD40 repeat protein